MTPCFEENQYFLGTCIVNLIKNSCDQIISDSTDKEYYKWNTDYHDCYDLS